MSTVHGAMLTFQKHWLLDIAASKLLTVSEQACHMVYRVPRFMKIIDCVEKLVRDDGSLI